MRELYFLVVSAKEAASFSLADLYYATVAWVVL